MKAPSIILFALLITGADLRAQIVNDGATVTLANVTNTTTGTVTVGTNGSFTLLVLSNNVLVTNSTGGVIGANATAKSNEVRLVSPTARWKMGGTLMVGSGGERNQLVVSNGGSLTANRGSVGDSSSHNQAVVSGAGSVWSNVLSFVAGFSGHSNRMEVTSGGLLNNGVGAIGDSGNGNEVAVTGTGSLWESRRDLTIGSVGVGNRLLVSDAGRVLNSNSFIGFQSAGNLAVVGGAGSVWSNRYELTVGHSGGGNQLIVTNGGLVASSNGYLGRAVGALGNVASVSGAGSLWTNSADLFIGSPASGGRLEVRAGGTVSTGRGLLGATNSTFNTLVVADPGSKFLASTELLVGHGGAQNSLVVSNGGWALSSTSFVGYARSASNNSAFVIGAGSVWSNRSHLTVGSNSPGNRVEVRDGGSVFVNNSLYVGRHAQSVSNLVLVTDPGSIWSNAPGSTFELGSVGSGNRLLVSNGGRVQLPSALVGGTSASEGNEAVLTGPGSMVDASFLILGNSSSRNRLQVRSGASLFTTGSALGFSDLARNNEALVTDPGSFWAAERLIVGFLGAGSQLVLSNGGTVVCPQVDIPEDREEHALVVGELGPSTNNRVVVNGGVLRVANGNGTAALDVRRGTNVLNAGLIDVDRLLLTNALSRFEFNGGTLITRGAVISNSVFVVGNAGSVPAVWEVRAGVGDHFVADGVTVGDTGSFAQLIHTNGALLTNGAEARLGRQASSRSNSVTLAGPTSSWWLGDGVVVGDGGSGNRLEVRDGASVVTTSISYLGLETSSSNNEAVVTGPGSSWFTANFGLRVGDQGRNNRLLVSDGGMVSSFDDLIGVSSSGSNNQVLVTGSGSFWNNTRELAVGFNSSGNQLVVSNGGTVFTVANKYVGENDGALSNTAIVTGPGSAWLGDDSLYVGAAGSFNRLLVRNGARVTSGIATLGGLAGADGNQALVTDAGSSWTNQLDLNVGEGGSGNRLTISNAATLASLSSGFIGRLDTAISNTVLLTDVGSRWLIASNLYVGSNGPFSRLVISNGAQVQSDFAAISAGLTSSNNEVLISGAGSIWTNRNELNVGRFGRGNSLVVVNGGRADCVNATIGFNASASESQAIVSGPGSFWRVQSSLDIGNSSSGNRLVVSNGASLFDDAVTIGLSGANNEALVTGPGTTWTNRIAISVGRLRGHNQLVISNGAFVLAGNVFVSSHPGSTNNRVVMDGGTLLVTNTTGGVGALDVRRGTNLLNAGLIDVARLFVTNTLGQFEFNGGKLVASGTAVSNGRVFTVGNGASAATFTLQNGVHSFANDLVIASNATLAGHGTITGVLTTQPGGTISPGLSVGAILLSNSPSLQGTAIMEISKGGAALTNDQIQVTGPLTYGGSLIISNSGPDALIAGDRFRLFAASAYSGSFSNLTLPPLASGLIWTNRLLVDGSIQVMSVAPPGFSSVSLSGTNLILAGTNGAANASFTVLASTNVALPLSNWVSFLTNQFDAGGQFSFTNSINLSEPQRFFRLRTP